MRIKEVVMFADKKLIDFREISAEYLTIYNVTDKDVFYDLDGEYECFPSDLTMLVTALVALKYCKLDDEFAVGDEQIVLDEYMDPACVGLEVGEVWTFRELLYMMILNPASDAAYAIAYNVMNSLHEYDNLSMNKKFLKFMELMDEYCLSIGCENCHFKSISGSEYVFNKIVLNVSSTDDLAKVMMKAMKVPELVEIFKTKEITFQKGNKTYHIKNSIRNLHEDDEFYCKYMIGGIKGRSNLAGSCLLCAAEGKEHTFVMAMVNAHSDELCFKDAKVIFDCIFGDD